MAESSGEISTPGEGAAGAPEELSEEAKQRFAQAAQAMQTQQRDEGRAKKKDDQLARTIVQFLNDPEHTRFFVLISKLVARNSPSIFILGILSLINEDCLKAVKEYFSEFQEPDAHETVDASLALFEGEEGAALTEKTNRQLIDWITRLQMILAHDPKRILGSLMIDEKHIDGSILQLTVFVLQLFFQHEDRDLPYEKAQPLTASILQTVFEPFMKEVRKKTLESGESPE